jgi:uncharacterized membrane protein YphA (DoxX/SURF4 family)
MDYLLFSVRVAVAMVFAIAVIAKLGGRDAFSRFTTSLASFGLPPRARVAATVVLAELAAVVLLALAPHLGGAVAAILLCGFAAGIDAAIHGGGVVRCRCFGATSAALGPGHVIRNLALAIGSLGVALGPARGVNGDPGVVAAIVVGLAAGAAIARWDDLRFLFAPVSRSSR